MSNGFNKHDRFFNYSRKTREEIQRHYILTGLEKLGHETMISKLMQPGRWEPAGGERSTWYYASKEIFFDERGRLDAEGVAELHKLSQQLKEQLKNGAEWDTAIVGIANFFHSRLDWAWWFMRYLTVLGPHELELLRDKELYLLMSDVRQRELWELVVVFRHDGSKHNIIDVEYRLRQNDDELNLDTDPI